MKVHAFGNHAPDEIMQLLKNAGFPRSSIHICERRGNLAKRNRYEHIIFLSFNDLKRQVIGPSYDTATFYVFDDPLRLFRVGLAGADYGRSETIYLDGLTLTKLDKLPEPERVELSELDMQPDLIEMATAEVKAQKTLLTQFMTFIYSLPSASHQKPIKELAFQWMVTKEPMSKLHKRLDAIGATSPLSVKQRARLCEVMGSEVTELYRLALRQEGDEDEVAKRMMVSAYELRYIRAILKSSKR